MIVKASFQRNPFVGMYVRANDSIALIPKNSIDKFEELVAATLGVNAVRIFVDESYLIGIFAAMNSSGCILSRFAQESERKAIKSCGLNVCVLKGSFSPGNTILANDAGAIVSPLLSQQDRKCVSDCLGVEAFQQPVTNISTIGAINAVTNKGLLAYNDISEVEFRLLEKIFKVKGSLGSVNFGSTAIGLGLAANSKGALVGEATTGFEMQRVFEGLFG